MKFFFSCGWLWRPNFSGAENLCITSSSVEVFGVSATAKEEFWSSPIPFLDLSALVAMCVGLLVHVVPIFDLFGSFSVKTPTWGDILLNKIPLGRGVLTVKLCSSLFSPIWHMASHAEPSSTCLSLVDSVLPHWGGLETPFDQPWEPLKPLEPSSFETLASYTSYK